MTWKMSNLLDVGFISDLVEKQIPHNTSSYINKNRSGKKNQVKAYATNASQIIRQK
jgi:hypothetical protein